MTDGIVKKLKNGERVIELTVMRAELTPDQPGRPRLVLTEDGGRYIEQMAGYGATQAEIADALGVSLNTLHNDSNRDIFETAIKKGSNEFKTSLRVAQMKAAKNGSVPMLIFLGKNYLGQTDKVTQDVAIRRTKNDITVDEAIEWLQTNDYV